MTVSGKPLRNVLWLVGERFARASVTALVLGIVARHLAPAGFGRLNLAITAFAIAAALANLGLDGLVVGELVRRPTQTPAVLGTALWLRLAAGAIISGLCWVAAWVHPAGGDVTLIAIVNLGLLPQPAEVIDLCFQRHLESRRTVVARFGSTLASAAVKLCLVANGASVAAFAWAQVAEAVFFAVALWVAWRRSPHHDGRWSWDRAIARDLLAKGLPLAAAGAVVTFSLRLDQLLARELLGLHASGIYFAASRLIDIALFIGSATTLSLFPALVASQTRQPEEYRDRLQAMFDLLSAMGWVIALGLTVGGAWVVRWLYGPGYESAGGVLTVLGWACVFLLNAGVRWQFILLSAPTLLNLAAAVVSIVIQFALAWWLAPSWGAPGVALAWLVAAIASGFATSFVFPPLRACAPAQTRGLLILFSPARWRRMFALLSL